MPFLTSVDCSFFALALVGCLTKIYIIFEATVIKGWMPFLTPNHSNGRSNGRTTRQFKVMILCQPLLSRCHPAPSRSYARYNICNSTSQRHRCFGASTNSRKRQRRKSPTSNPALVREPHTVFSVCQPCLSPLWLAIRLLTSGDMEQDPGPE